MPFEDAAREAPGDEAQAEGQQERRQQHQDQGGPVAEGEFDVFEANEEYFSIGVSGKG